MPDYRMKVAPHTVSYADETSNKLVVEFAIPGAPTETIDVKILEYSIHLAAPARDIEYVSSLALAQLPRQKQLTPLLSMTACSF